MASRSIAILVAIAILFPLTAMATNHQVSIVDFAFSPNNLTVDQGDTVTWTNNGSFIHTSTSNTGLWNSGDLSHLQSYSFAFDTSGTFDYHCAHHVSMTATVIVNPLPTFDIEVAMRDNFFDPAVIQIRPGQIVRWTNMGIHDHTTTSDDGIWDSGTLTPGQFFDWTFPSEGVYHYHCAIHSLVMKGAVIVGKPDSVAFDIHIIDFAFQPADTSLSVGQNVRWINFGAVPHTSTDTTGNLWDSGTLNPGDVFTLHADSAGAFHYLCLFHPESMTGTLTVFDTTSGGCSYVIGDINGSGIANGIDVVYGVGYFKGGPPPPDSCDCPSHGMLYAAGDVNGNCVFNGIDITYFVTYLKGGPALQACVDCPPAP